MGKYIQKPLTIEAEQVTSDNPRPYEKQGAIFKGLTAFDSAKIWYNGVDLSYNEGDYIVQRQDGTYFPMCREDFEGNYEPQGS